MGGTATGGAEVVVEAFDDLRRLPLIMDEVGDQADAIVRHARTWVASRRGFEPSPVCLLRPLAEAMDAVSWAFEEAGRRLAEEWSQVRAGVVVAERELADADRAAAAACTALARKVG